MSDPRTAVVSRDQEAVVPERVHHLDLVRAIARNEYDS